MFDLSSVQAASQDSTMLAVIYASLLSAVLSGLVAWTYSATFHGLSFSKSYVQSLILVSLVAATIMQAVGDSIARGLGIMGALAVVRFRTAFTDPKDLVFLFAALAAGLGCGIYAWTVSVVGTIAFCVAAWVLYRADIGDHLAYDGLVRFSIGDAEASREPIATLLRRDLKHFALVSMREVAGGTRLDCAYQVKFRRGRDAAVLMKGLSEVPSLTGAHFMMQESTLEL
ncbi:MAG: DUF4956 domain-containing protein [Fibrobacterota bacterium]|nr:DUF4956 domain-containing protein [Fibrobacterota bacterium]QQS04816.1 MAG: DUF4956 domain-containing protein [Fibrobacterota bacterium]